MTDVFTAVLELTIVSAIVTVLLLLFEKLISKRFSAKLYYFAWLVLAVRMMLPISLPTIEAPVNVKIPDRTVTVTYADPPQQTVPDMPHTDQSTDVDFTMPEDLPVFIYPTPERPQQQVKESIPLSSIACSIWLCGAAAVLIYYVIQYFVFRIRLRKRISVSDQSILGVLDGVCTDLNIKNASVSYFDGAKGPMLVGYFRPIIVLPSDYSCDERTLDLIFTHELTHFKRRDLWYKLFMNVVSAVYWFNPFAWIMRSNAFKAVELSCDCDVVKDRPTEYRGQYSKAILSEVASRHAASQGYSTYFANDKRILKERFSYILDMNVRKLGITVLCFVVLISVVVTAIVACDFNQDGNTGPDDPSVSDETVENPVQSPVTEEPEGIPIVAFSIVSDENFNFAVAGILEDGSVMELFRFDRLIADISVDNGRLYVMLPSEIGYIDLTSSEYEYTPLFSWHAGGGPDAFQKFEVHDDYIYLLYTSYEVGNFHIDRIPVNAEGINKVERYQDCMPMGKIFIDKQNDLLYYYLSEFDESSSEETVSVYTRDLNTDKHTCIVSDLDVYRNFDEGIFSPLHFGDYIIFTHNSDDGNTALFLRDIREKTSSVLDFDIKSYAVSGKYLYFIGRDGTLSALDLENKDISKHLFPSEIKEEIISIQPYGLEKVLFWALTYDDEQHVNGHVFKIADSEGIIEDSKYMSFSSPVYVTDFEYYQPQKSDEPVDPDMSPVEEGSEEKAITAFSIVCDNDWNYSVAGVFDDGNVEELFGFGEEPVLDIDIDNGRLYVLLDDEIGYIDLASDKYEYTHLFYSDSHEGYNSFYRFAVHKGYIYLLYGTYDVGDVYVDRIAITANSISEAERYQNCMLMDDIFIDKDNDLFYYYHAENEGLIPDVTSVYARDMKTNLSNRILSDTDMFRFFDGNISDFRIVKDLFVYTYTPDSGETHLCLLDLSTKQESIINFDIKSYSISGKYIYYIDSEGVLSAYDMEKDEIVGFTFPHQFDQEEVIIDSFGLDDVLVRAFTFNEDWSIKDSVYQIIYSDGNISESDKFRSSSAPVYITEPIVSSGPSDVLIEDKPISFGEKRFTELFENIASYIGKGIFDGNSMTDEDKFFLAYFFGECDGSNSEYGDIYPVDYIQNLLETHISEDYASRFEPKNVSFYNPATTSFLFPTDFKKSFDAKVEQSGIDDILNVYKYSSDGNNLERIYIASLSVYSSALGEMSWKIDSYYEKLTETSSDLDTIGKHLFDVAVMSYGDTYKDFEYTSIVFDDNKTIVIGYDDRYIGFELFFSNNGLGVMSAELVDVEKYITKPIEPVPEESLKLNDLKEFEKYIIQAFRDGDHNLLNLLMGEQKYLSLPADPSISVATDTGYTELNIQIGENGYLYSRKLIDSASFNVLNYTESLAYCVEKANDRFYLRSFGIYVEPNVVYFDVENYISFPGTDKIPFTVSAESWKTCSNLNLFAEAIRVAIKNGDWNLIAEMGAGYSNEEQNGVTTIIPSLKIYREISSVVCSYEGGNEYRYDIETTDGQKETLYIVISKDYDGNNTLSVNRSSSYVAPVPVPIEPVTEEIYDSDIAELFEKLHLYQKYAEYSSASMKVDSSVTDESGMYNKVIDEKYDTWDEWTAFVSSVFCGNYLTNTKNNDLYINVDGFTYCMQGGMGWYLSEDYTYNIVENNNSEVVIDITYKENSPTVGDEETYQTFRYVLQLTENGWRIADQLPV